MRNELPKTIQIFLPSGDPQGIRVAEITTRIIRVFDVPRSLIGEFIRMPEAGQVGLYFLLGENEDTGALQVYIGQTGSVGERLVRHNQSKDFWSRVLVAVSLTNSLTNTHASYLEWMSIRLASQCSRYLVENGNAGSRPHTPAPMEADCQEIHETVAALLATLGHPLFEPLAKRSDASEPQEVYFCTGSGANGRGLYTEEGFVVLKDSFGRAEMVPSYVKSLGARIRLRLIEQGVLRQDGDRLVFQKDTLFSSPSAAAHVLMGRTANGWVDWRDGTGRTLAQVKRSELLA